MTICQLKNNSSDVHSRWYRTDYVCSVYTWERVSQAPHPLGGDGLAYFADSDNEDDDAEADGSR